MAERMFNQLRRLKLNDHQQTSSSPLTETADSGITSRITPLSSISENKVDIHVNDDEYESATSEKTYSPSMTGMIVDKPILQYKRSPEYMQYSNCLVTYLDHPSAIFIQLVQDGPAFQRMHQDMNRYYMNHLHDDENPSIHLLSIGDFCVAYSKRYFEFFRARILNIDYRNQQCLVIYVDFGNSEWIHVKGLRPLHREYTVLEVQCIPVTLSHIVPKKDLRTGLINWDTEIGKQCTRKVRRSLMKPDGEPLLLVCVTFLSREPWWPLCFVEIKIDGQNLSEILHQDGLARLTRTNQDLKKIYPSFGVHRNEHLILGLSPSERYENRSSING